MLKAAVKALLAVALLAAAFFLSNELSLRLSRALDWTDERLLFEYASDGRFDYDVYFGAEADARTGILRELRARLDPGKSSGLIGLAHQIDRYQVELLPVFYGNRAYLDYLRERETSVAELFEFCRQLDELAENFIASCRYLLFLAWVVALHLIMRCRPALYLLMGVLCVCASVFKLSDKLFAILLFRGKTVFDLYATDIVPTLLEAMLTFLIFDITIAALEKYWSARRRVPARRDLPALYFLIAYLSQNADSPTLYRPGLSALLPNLTALAKGPLRRRAGPTAELTAGLEKLAGPHTNRTLLRDLAALLPLLEGK